MRIVAQEAPGRAVAGGVFYRLKAEILAYRIFPPSLIRGELQRSPIQQGDPVGIRFVALRGLHLFFVAEATQVFEEEQAGWWAAGFYYQTLQGHPECGEERFAVEKNMETGEIRVSLSSYSRPGLWYTSLATPILRRLQRYASIAALDHLASKSATVST